MDELLKTYIFEPNNPYSNYDLADQYFERGEYASAISFYIKCRDRTDDVQLKKECLLKCIECFKNQGKKESFIKSIELLLSDSEEKR